MQKVLTIIGLSIQRQTEVRNDFLFERIRSICILFSIYFLWSALLANQESVLGYARDQLLSYVLLMTLLSAWVMGNVSDRIPSEIAKGNLSDVLLRPVSHMTYWAAQDVANKILNLSSAVVEIIIFMILVSAPFYIPKEVWVWGGFALTVVGAMILYFQMSYLLGVLGFWTAQSWGPRFCFEVILEFCAGAYFPIDVLPGVVQKVLLVLPFPYLIFYPISIYLGRVEPNGVFICLGVQAIWIVILSFLIKYMWRKGLRQYGAEGR